ncbi:MAG TPA: nucleoside kinase [Anaeromyxobacteraceae bacterium]|nr:nucleoside kinase [Anaeromyxobacteraceae bacterium]
MLAHAELLVAPPRTRVHGDADAGRHLFIVAAGRAVWRREHLALRHLGPGDHFGELSPLGERHLGEVVTSDTALTAARLGPAGYAALSREAPGVALSLALALADGLGREVARLSEDVGTLMRGRTAPRAETVRVSVQGDVRVVPTGTRLRALLPAEQDGALVVAGLLGCRPVSLQTPIYADSTLAPLTMAHWEGRQIYAQSVGLLLLEAAQAEAPLLRLRLGPSRGTVQVVQVEGAAAGAAADLAGRLAAAMEAHAAADAPFRLEYWGTDEAIAWFQQRGWTDAVKLLRMRRQATVRLVSCGQCYALSMGPLLPSTGALQGFSLEPHPEGLALRLGPRDPRTRAGRREPPAAPVRDHRDDSDGDMAAEHQAWLAAMGITSVGALSEACVDGRVAQLIRVAEGFQEKRISRIADRIAAARDRIRIIAIAGPSSSGKSTFIARLTVQLQIDGLNPVTLSLDDYYVDREKTPRDEKGDWDFEALQALDLATLQDHVRRLLAGEAVRTPRYDFLSGRSVPDGGHELQLRPGDVLMLEGIHGLDPALLGAIPAPGELFRVFIHPATTLPFDRLTRVSATDLRLLRRIVRDRHQRGYKAAENIARWPSVQAGEREHIFPFQAEADAVFDSSLVYEPAVLKIFAERYLLEVPPDHPAFPTAHRLRYLVDRFVAIHPEHVPPTSLLREFIGGGGSGS